MRYYWEKTMRKDLKKDKMKNQVSDKKTELFDEEYIRKAEELEKALWADGDCEEETYTEEEINHSYEKLVNMLMEDGIYREDEPSEEKVIPMTRRKPGIIRWGKVAGVAILCCACIFAASMTSEANRNYFIERIQYATGNDTKIITGNDEENEDINFSEQEAVRDIENQLGVEIPEFYYRPTGFDYITYEVNTSTNVARMEYKYKDSIILFMIDKQKNNSASKIVSMHGNKKDTVFTKSDNIQVQIEKTEGEEKSISTYSAQWQCNDTAYVLSGKIELDEIKKIIEDMIF